MEKLTESQLTYLTDVDHHDHEAMIAFDLSTPGEVVGVGRYVREGESTDRAEAAVTVADDWQGKGLGGALTQILAGRAVEEGISAFTALLLADNDQMAALLGEVGRVEVVEQGGGLGRGGRTDRQGRRGRPWAEERAASGCGRADRAGPGAGARPGVAGS